MMFRLLLWAAWTTFILPALFVTLSCNPDTVVDAGGENDTDTVELEVVSALLAAPLVFAPTRDRFEVNAVAADGDPETLRLFVRQTIDKGWTEVDSVRYPASDIAEWSVTDLSPGTAYQYAIVTGKEALKALEEADSSGVADDSAADPVLYSGTAVTRRESGASFSVALITDPHIGADLRFSNQGIPEVLQEVGSQVKNYHPDFIINLGDMVDFHQFGFEPPPTDTALRSAYINYRFLLGDAIGQASHFQVIGNWDGENGWFSGEEIAASRAGRHLYMPGPSSGTYPEGGSTEGGYYAFTWGDALFIVLNVQSYTTTMLSLSLSDGNPDDWTLGEEQLAWLKKTLESASSKWRFIFIHHTVGGAAGTLSNSIYGRGGGLAARVGEQATIHQLMIDNDVDVFFYGHDHVFTDMVVDNIHYTLPGSAGAPWLFTESETGYTTYWGVSGWAKLDIAPGSVHVQFIDLDGNAIYEYTL
jgi:3',5'-cyclic AMP phosphodiesterase CpdA